MGISWISFILSAWILRIFELFTDKGGGNAAHCLVRTCRMVLSKSMNDSSEVGARNSESHAIMYRLFIDFWMLIGSHVMATF